MERLSVCFLHVKKNITAVLYRLSYRCFTNFHDVADSRPFWEAVLPSWSSSAAYGWEVPWLDLQTEILSYLMLLSINGGKVASISSSTSLEDGQQMHTLGSRLQRCHEASWHLLWVKLCCKIMPEEQAPWQTLALQAC